LVTTQVGAQDVGKVRDSIQRTLSGWVAGKQAEPQPSAAVPANRSAPIMYRYIDSHGRAVYTNIEEQVPLDQRVAAKIDLSHVSLNGEIAGELDHRLHEEHTALTKSPYCRELRKAAETDLLSSVWNNYPSLVMCAAALLAFILYSPIAIKRFGGQVWARTLSMAIPALTITGLISFSITETNKSISRLKQEAAPCSETAFTKLSGAANPVARHAELVAQLRMQMDAINAEAR
jgi:hypothetical protein